MQTLITNSIICGDCVERIKQYIPSGSIDLIYMDPPFFSGRNYEVIWDDGSEVRSFEDKEFYKRVCGKCEKNMPQEYVACPYCGEPATNAKDIRMNDIESYLEWLRVRLVECRRALKPTGSIYVHLDWHACHYVKVMMDEMFGYKNFKSEVVWHYTGGGRSKRYFSHKHDVILFYTKSDEYTFNIENIRVPYKETSGYAQGGIISKKGKRYMPNPKGTPVDDVWDMPIINPLSHERLGYPTQKPEALLERIIVASSNPGDLVLDPFCGCGTALTVAERLKRRWVGIDVSPTACDVIAKRLRDNNKYPISNSDIIDMPVTVDQLRTIAPFEFQNRINNWLGGRQTPKGGGDRGIDGYTFDMTPIQIKQSDGVGRQIIALFEHDIRDVNKKRGILVAFGFADTAKKEVDHIKVKHGIEIKLVTVNDLIIKGSDCGIFN